MPQDIAAELQKMLDGSPFHEFLRMHVKAFDADAQSLDIVLPFEARYERMAKSGQIHGGVIAALIDIVGDFALIGLLQQGVPTINLRVDYLRAATNTDLHARAQVRRSGRTVGVVDIDVKDNDGRLVAIGRGTYGTSKG